MPDNKNIWRKGYPNTEEEFENVIKNIRNNITFDVGHWIRQKYDVYSLLQKYSKRIINIHLHDVKDDVDHQALGTGLLDLEKFLYTLKKIEYSHYVTIELVQDNIRGIFSSYDLLKKLIKRVYK